MHFSIPETREIKSGFKTFIAYDIYINGSFHCSLRYRQLYHFHLQLKKAFGANCLPNFPSKKLFPLNAAQIEERRSQLERYIKIASQDSQIANSDLFNGFLLAAQQESNQDHFNSDCVDIYLMDWKPIRLIINKNENSDNVLRKFFQTIKIHQENFKYFSLYLVKRFKNDNLNQNNEQNSFKYHFIRRLQNFESPLLTLKTMNRLSSSSSSSTSSSTTIQQDNPYVIIVHRSYWDINFDQDLFNDPIALNIIYLQALYDVENKNILLDNIDDNLKRQLIQAKNLGNKLQYIKLIRQQKYYGYIYFEPCQCDFFYLFKSKSNHHENNNNQKKTNVKIYAGNQELLIRVLETNEEYSFRLTRIKCWRLTTSSHFSSNSNDNNRNDNNDKDCGRFELSFEYLLDEQSLKWITVFSKQAILMSYCLQSMAEEMLKREGRKEFRYSSNSTTNLVNHQTTTTTNNNQNGNHHVSLIGSSENDSVITTNNNNNNHQTNLIDPLLSFGHDQSQVVVENGVFDGIGDDDL